MRYIFAFVGFMLLIVVGLLLITSNRHKSPSKPVAVIKTLPDYADSSSSVIMTIDGVINGDDAHSALRVTVSSNSRTLDTIQGYSGHVISTTNQTNTQDAYSVFLKALNTTGYLTKLKKPTGPNDPTGQCPDGTRVIFELTNNADTVSSLWASSCDIGDFGGNADLAQLLFQRQITGYQNLTDEIQL